jgi:isoleucyl-tRNA synthetase
MIAMATVLEKKNPFRTLLGYATVVGEDGRPMHKSMGNMIEFGAGADTIGVDVMRWIYVTSNPLQNVLFGYKLADEVRRSFHLILWNTYNFFISYALANGFSVNNEKVVVLHILDRWIYAYLQRIIKKATDSLLEYDAQTATLEIGRFVTDFSQWYVRRSRDRVSPTAERSKDKAECFETMYLVLRTLAQMLAPFCPFISDEIYRNLTGEPSVHLTSWPQADKKAIDINLLDDMERVRSLVEKIHAKRKELKIPVRQPLAGCQLSAISYQLSDELLTLIKDETNIKDISFSKGEGEITVELDTIMSPELIEEGKIREAVRKIQQLRKDQGCKLTDRVRIELPKEFQTFPKEGIDKIVKNTLAGDVVWGDTYRVIL